MILGKVAYRTPKKNDLDKIGCFFSVLNDFCLLVLKQTSAFKI